MIVTIDTDKEPTEGLKRAIALLQDVLDGKSPAPQPTMQFTPRPPPSEPPAEPKPAAPAKPAPKKREEESSSVIQIY